MSYEPPDSGKAGRLTSLAGALQRVQEARLCASDTRDTATSMEWQAAPVSAAPAVLSTEATPKAAASVPPAGDEAPPAAPPAEAPPVNTRLSPTDEDPTAGAAAPPAEAEHTPSSNEAEQTPSSHGSDDDDEGACGVCGSKHIEEEVALIFCDGCDVAVHQLC